MDNASKALIIVGEVLIAILVLSLMVAVFISFGNFSAKMHEHMTESQITEFNSHFLSMEHRVNITAQEIATIINYTKQLNDKRELDYNTRVDSEYYTTIALYGVVINGGTKNIEDVFKHSSFVNSADDYNNNLQSILAKFIKENNTYYFSCNATIKKYKDKDTELEIEYEDYYDNGTTSKDIIYNKKTGLINKIIFRKTPIIDILNYDKYNILS